MNYQLRFLFILFLLALGCKKNDVNLSQISPPGRVDALVGTYVGSAEAGSTIYPAWSYQNYDFDTTYYMDTVTVSRVSPGWFKIANTGYSDSFGFESVFQYNDSNIYNSDQLRCKFIVKEDSLILTVNLTGSYLGKRRSTTQKFYGKR